MAAGAWARAAAGERVGAPWWGEGPTDGSAAGYRLSTVSLRLSAMTRPWLTT